VVADLSDQIEKLKQALREAIASTGRVTRRLTKNDPAGSSYEVSWLQQTEEWAALCGLDLSELDPSYYLKNW
jgi:hypothetical protein